MSELASRKSPQLLPPFWPLDDQHGVGHVRLEVEPPSNARRGDAAAAQARRAERRDAQPADLRAATHVSERGASALRGEMAEGLRELARAGRRGERLADPHARQVPRRRRRPQGDDAEDRRAGILADAGDRLRPALHLAAEDARAAALLHRRSPRRARSGNARQPRRGARGRARRAAQRSRRPRPEARLCPAVQRHRPDRLGRRGGRAPQALRLLPARGRRRRRPAAARTAHPLPAQRAPGALLADHGAACRSAARRAAARRRRRDRRDADALDPRPRSRPQPDRRRRPTTAGPRRSGSSPS